MEFVNRVVPALLGLNILEKLVPVALVMSTKYYPSLKFLIVA